MNEKIASVMINQLSQIQKLLTALVMVEAKGLSAREIEMVMDAAEKSSGEAIKEILKVAAEINVEKSKGRPQEEPTP